MGTTAYNLSQWALLVIAARLIDKAAVGQISLILAISAPVFLTIGLNLRTIQVTDASHRWRFREYLALRHILNVVALTVTIGLGLLVGLRGGELATLMAIGVAKCVESVSHTYYGYFQKYERLDLVARSLLLRSVAGPVCFGLGILLGGDLAWGGVGLLAGWLIPQWLADRPSARKLSLATLASLGREEPIDWSDLWRLARKGAPLGIDAGLSSLAINAPRYAVHLILGAASLGTYAALAYLAQTVQMVTSSLSSALIARLAQYHHQGRRRDFRNLLLRLTGFGVAVVAVAMLGAASVGGAFLSITLGSEYADQWLLIALMLSAGVITVQRSLCRALEASWRFKTYVLVDAITTAVVVISAPFFIRHLGLEGAAVALATGFGTGTIVVTIALIHVLRSMPAHASEGSATLTRT